MNVLFVAVCVVLLVLLVHFFVNIRDVNTKLGRWTVCPKGNILLGHIPDFASTSEIIQSCRNFQMKYGNLLQLNTGFCFPFVLIADLKFLELMFTSTKIINKSIDYSFFERWLSKGLFTSNGQQWRQMRKLITPAFHFQILEQFIDVFNDSCEKFIEKIGKTTEKSIDIDPQLRLLTLDIICQTSLGTSPDENSDYVKAIHDVTTVIAVRGFSMLKQVDAFYYFTKDYWKEKRAVKILHDYTYDLIHRRRQENSRKETTKTEENVDSFGRKKRRAFLDLLLETEIDGRSLTDVEIRQECDTIMFAGHDTTGTALGFILYCLANNPHVQELVVEELRTIFGDDKMRQINLRDINEMRYLEMVVKETLRLYPPAPFFSRQAITDEEFDGGIIPPNVPLVAFPFGVHRDPEIYPDPEIFDPERFSPENHAKRHPFSYLSFSAGPRNCIGQKFAMLEMKNITANLMRKFEVLPDKERDVELTYQIVLRSSNGVHVKFRQRAF